jgi:hypothetical protein
MSAALIERTKGQRPVIRLLFLEGVETSGIYERIIVQLRKDCMLQRKVYKCVESFKERGHVHECVYAIGEHLSILSIYAGILLYFQRFMKNT